MALVPIACTQGSVDSSVVRDRTDMQHGLHTGQMIAEVTLPCEARSLALGQIDALQFVTFATPTDCSSCSAHFGGLEHASAEIDRILLSANPRGANAIVVWATNTPEDQRSLTIMRHESKRLVCEDKNGTLWKTYNLQHTPVSALIAYGHVMYLTDRPFVLKPSEPQLLDDLRRVITATRP
jgi:hypothetical protein